MYKKAPRKGGKKKPPNTIAGKRLARNSEHYRRTGRRNRIEKEKFEKLIEKLQFSGFSRARFSTLCSAARCRRRNASDRTQRILSLARYHEATH